MHYTIPVSKPKVTIDARSGMVTKYENDEMELLNEILGKKE